MAREKYKLIIKTEPVDSSQGKSLPSPLLAVSRSLLDLAAQMAVPFSMSDIATKLAAMVDPLGDESNAFYEAFEFKPGEHPQVYDDYSLDEIEKATAAKRELDQFFTGLNQSVREGKTDPTEAVFLIKALMVTNGKMEEIKAPQMRKAVLAWIENAHKPLVTKEAALEGYDERHVRRYVPDEFKNKNKARRKKNLSAT